METDILFTENCLRLLPKFREMQNFATEEVWEDVKGYEGIYQVSNMGRVKSLPRVTVQYRIMEERILAFKMPEGYPAVSLAKDGINKYYSVHRLVAMTFIKESDNNLIVNHIDGNKTNNCWWNLEWVTPTQNNRHAVDIGLYYGQNQIKLTAEIVRHIRSLENPNLHALSREYGLDRKTLRCALEGKTWKHVPRPDRKTPLVKCDSNDIKDGYLCQNEGVLPQKYAGIADRGHSRGTLKTKNPFEAKQPLSPIGKEAKKPGFQKSQAQLFFSWEKSEKREVPTITLPITTHPIRVEELPIRHSKHRRTRTPKDKICTVDGCKEPRLEVGYQRYARCCEAHHKVRLENGSRKRLVQVVYLD